MVKVMGEVNSQESSIQNRYAQQRWIDVGQLSKTYVSCMSKELGEMKFIKAKLNKMLFSKAKLCKLQLCKTKLGRF